MEQTLAAQPHDEAYFWATHQGAEMDLVLRRGDKLFGVVFKRADVPRITPSIRIALEDLRLEKISIICFPDYDCQGGKKLNKEPLVPVRMSLLFSKDSYQNQSCNPHEHSLARVAFDSIQGLGTNE